MLKNLPEPSLERLRHSPLDLVVCQIRHDRDSSAADPKKALKIRDALDGAYPVMDEMSDTELAVAGNAKGVQSVQHGTRTSGWKLQSPDGEWTVVVTPESYALETSRYLDWDDFAERLHHLTDAVADQFDITIQKRLGLRYVDRISAADIERPQEWEPWIHPTLLGPILHPGFGAAVKAMQGTVTFDVEDANQVVLRHGIVKTGDDGWSYLLDHDCFHDEAVEFAPDTVMRRAEELHTIALQVFQAAITSEMFRLLKGDESQ